jgi:hypothetical protein
LTCPRRKTRRIPASLSSCAGEDLLHTSLFSLFPGCEVTTTTKEIPSLGEHGAGAATISVWLMNTCGSWSEDEDERTEKDGKTFAEEAMSLDR